MTAVKILARSVLILVGGTLALTTLCCLGEIVLAIYASATT